VVVDRYRQDLFGAFLPHDILVEDRFDFGRLGNGGAAWTGLILFDFFVDDVVAQSDAFIADVDRRPCDEFLDFFLRFSAKRTAQIAILAVVTTSVHIYLYGFISTKSKTL
jgi:hypothetical protein